MTAPAASVPAFDLNSRPTPPPTPMGGVSPRPKAIRVCEICREIFESSQKDAKYCSLACLKEQLKASAAKKMKIYNKLMAERTKDLK